MFKKKNFKSEMSFSLCLAYEILRHNLKEDWGLDTMLLSCITSATNIEACSAASNNYTLCERASATVGLERYITLKGVFVSSKTEVKDPEAIPFMATVRVFTVSAIKKIWEPHYVHIMTYRKDQNLSTLRAYRNGFVHGVEQFKNAKNHCRTMIEMQLFVEKETV